jgi:hypothetical protein
MFSAIFWKQAMERAIKSAAQGLIGLWIGDGLNAWTIDIKLASGVAAGAALLSVLTSIVSLPVGQQTSPSLVGTGSPSLVSTENESPSLVPTTSN